MSTSYMLDLSSIEAGYKWLTEHSECFNMSKFISTRTHRKEMEERGLDRLFYKPVVCTPVIPECGTTLCLAGAILLANALNKGEETVSILIDHYDILTRVLDLVEKDNPELLPLPLELSIGLRNVFMGDIFFDREEYSHVYRMTDIRLEDLKKELDLLYNYWGYVPLMEESK